MEDRIREFMSIRNELYAELIYLIKTHLKEVKDTEVLRHIDGGKGWISNVVDEAVINPPEPWFFERADMCSIVVSCQRQIPHIFFVNKKLTKVYCYI